MCSPDFGICCCLPKRELRVALGHGNDRPHPALKIHSVALTGRLSLGVPSFEMAEKNPLNLIEVILAQGSATGVIRDPGIVGTALPAMLFFPGAH